MAAARRYWFALMVCGVLLALSLPLYLTDGQVCRPEPSVEGMSMCTAPVSSPVGILGSHDLAHPGAVELYWLLALVGGSCALGWWYRRAGSGRRAAAGVLVAVLLTGATTVLTWADWHGFRTASAWVESAELLRFNGATPLLVIGAVLLALAVAERSAGLSALAVGFCGAAYVFATRDSFGVLHDLGAPVDVLNDPAGIRQLLNLAIPAAALLVAAGAAYAAGAPGRRRSRPAA
ncbi:hypothetical protein [Kitasatospora sp. CB02891]|uniref:hypothetical protein n=1 Tax=Kitasatospora sp. CB02891 TaxID=2020329 RepID=UPI000C280EE1|nr:hypothetical protein [Kitasatospora sp. CB02891]PJN26315.1 hypothetical protein CG736_13140 [Kitasatospora sp. CB02891]